MHRFLVSAAHKSSGKTTLSIGLAAALRARGLTVQPFKKGPDYIDPMWLSHAAGRACRNLDLYLADSAEVRTTYHRHAASADVALIEGNKGLHDGLALDGSNSNAALAALLDAPVVLVIDTRGMIRGIAPLLLGTQAFDPRVRIAGVILNRVGGPRHESKLREAIAYYTDIPVLGAVGTRPEFAILERHLGLTPSNETGETEQRIRTLAAGIADTVDLDALLAATAASALPAVLPAPAASAARVRIGIARDRAFGFYYADDLDALTAAGADLIPVDTLTDARLPALDGLFIGGGFPETQAAALAANVSLRADLRRQIDAGLPVYAECGGLMYLTRSITWEGRRHDMVGALPADTLMHAKPVGKGYVTLTPTAADPWPGAAPASIRGHEFHYSSLTALGPELQFAYQVQRGHGIDGGHDGLIYRNVLASYSHLRSTGHYNWAARFVAHVRRCCTHGPDHHAEAA